MSDKDIKTIVIQIGNSDDKLTQQQWSKYVERVYEKIKIHAREIHFSGGSQFDAPWQNACFIFEIKKLYCAALLVELRTIREDFNQDSIALTQGETSFI